MLGQSKLFMGKQDIRLGRKIIAAHKIRQSILYILLGMWFLLDNRFKKVNILHFST